MVKKLLLLCSFMLVVAAVWAQLPDPCPSNDTPAADDCPSACIYCNFNGYQGSTTGYSSNTPPGGFCGTIENEQWFGFIASAAAMTFTATTTNCTIGNGVQIALYSSCSSNFLACYGGCAGCAGTPASVTANLTPGQNYFLLLDGYAGDECDFTISISPNPAPPQVGPIGNIAGPSPICPGATVSYSVPPVTGAAAYNWTTTGGILINGQSSPVQTLAPGGNVVQLTIPAGTPNGSYQVCVQAINTCDQDNLPRCRNIQVQAINPMTLPSSIVCNEDLPYELPWGDLVSSSGTYQHTYTSWLGCDSIVRKPITVKPPIVRNLPPTSLCEGSCITICGEEYCDGGSFVHVCESFQGCDSTVNFAILLLNPEAVINGGGEITCTTPSLQLTSAPSPGNKVWRVLPGNTVVGSGNSLTVTAPGTYTLTVSAAAGGVMCIESDTIVITGNTTPPTISATGGIIGCGNSSAQLSASATPAGSGFVWSGPGGFTSTLPNPTVNTAGVYTVVATSNLNGCTASTTATVTGNTTPPQVSATGGTLTCTTTSITATASSNVPTATFTWTGPGGPVGNTPSVNITVPNTYTVTALDPSNGCTNTTTVLVDLNNTPPGAGASPSGIITCPTPTVTLSGTSTNGVSYNWAGPAFSSGLQNPTVGTAGVYTVTVTGANGCISTATTTVSGDTNLPNAAASGGTVSCGVPSIPINANSSTPGVNYNWTGPGTFTSNLQNPQANLPGIYTVTVTAGNLCTSTAEATVNGDFAVPDAAAVGGTITCSASSVGISASSSTPGANFIWSGPGGFSSTNANVLVNTTGDYTVTVTGLNGCTNTAVAPVVPDANIPNATSSGGVLNCTVTSLQLSGNSTTPGVNVAWTGPGGFSATTFTPTVNNPGQYIMTVTNPSNGCSAQATANVTLDDAQPGASASGDTITCTAPLVTLQGDSPAGSVSWNWSGPNGLTFNVQNPSTNEPGAYVLTVTGANGCTSTAGVTIEADQNIPVATAVADTLTCTFTSRVISTSVNFPVTYSWAGPNGFSSTLPNPTVNEPGDYTVTVTAANGCTDTEIITIQQNIAAPGGTTTGNTLDCNNLQVPISVSSSAVGAAYIWSGPNGFTSVNANPTVQLDGDYQVTITGANGCTSTAQAIVAIDTVTAALAATPSDILDCATPAIDLQTNVTPGSSPLQALDWSGPGGFTSSLEDPSVQNPGLYTLIATTQNGCQSQIQVLVDQDIAAPDATAAGNTLTCTITSATIDGGSATAGASFDWTGPGTFTSSLEDPSVNQGGTYTLVVTGPNGCTSTAEAVVLLDVALPGSIADKSNDLDCDDLATTLLGDSPTNSVAFAWTGPGTFVSTQQNPSASLPGDYILEVTGQNGCISMDTVTILQDIASPGATAEGDTLDCISGVGNVVGNSLTSGVGYSWSGPNNFSSTLQAPSVTVSGIYTVTVTGLNACTSTAETTVENNNDSPIVSLSGGGTITCAQVDVTITGTISTPGATGVWTGPNGFTSFNPAITVANPGNYTYTVTALNGCISAPAANVLIDVDAPQNVTAAGGLLNCTFPTITINAGSSTAGVTYNWSGPGNYTSSLQNPSDITNPGTYTVLVTDPTNGCTATGTAEVTQDPTVPDISVTTQTITCDQPAVVLDATSNTPNVNFKWTGPGIVNGVNDTVEDPSGISQAGNYTVVATAQSGCTASFNIQVNEDLASPGATAVGDTLTCTLPNGVIGSNSNTPNVTYQWSGPGAFSSSQQNPTVTLIGTYTVTITSIQNGCTSVATAEVSPDQNAPQITVSNPTISCNVPSVTINATTNIGVTWQWSGPNGFTSTAQSPTVTTPGGYTVIATAANGCSVNAGSTVEDDTDGPAVTVGTPNQLNCTTTQVPLSAIVQGAGTYTYAWTSTSGNILSGANSANPTVGSAAIYSVIVTDLSNGCTTLETVEVESDDSTPNAVFENVRDISCFGETDGSILIDSVSGGTPPYVFSLDGSPFSSSILFAGLTDGDHNLIVQDANGCEYEKVIMINEPQPFTVNLGLDTTILLGDYIALSLNSTVSDPGRLGTFRVTPDYVFPASLIDTVMQPIYSFQYTVTAVDTNGCTAKDSRWVIVNKERLIYIPNVFDPTSNGPNNLFMIFGSTDPEQVRNIKVFQVYDRWGNMVHEFRNFKPNDTRAGWDGRIRGDLAVPAVFVYFAEIEFIDDEVILYKGDVTLQR